MKDIREINSDLSTNPDLSLIKNYFINKGVPKTNGIVVECGTAQGNYNPSLYLENVLGWELLGFEPNPEFWSDLDKNRPNAIKIHKALSDYVGVSDFALAGDNSSMRHNRVHIEEYGGRPLQHITVPTTTWKEAMAFYHIPFVDLLILDVEGCEMQVLKGMSGCDVLPDVIMIEYPRSDYDFLLRNDTTKEDFSGFKAIKDALSTMGYGFDYIRSANAMFSKHTFWDGRIKPVNWFGSDPSAEHCGYLIYDQEKCKNI
jgi:FkbM family methyltransferase